MKLNRELCASRRKLSQQVGWTIVLDAVGIVRFNSYERSEFTSILTSNLTSETSVKTYWYGSKEEWENTCHRR